jgi:hypothetical protein
LKLFINEIYVCALLNNFFWGVWALSLLTEKPESCAINGIFNFDAAIARAELFKHI